ncbi:MAG: PQQ-binding-like beta-propeller repeat protein [Planctomycetaceae bacterium]|nr:PQQ-binding-like beta-propeller repeat protein [Planctomycetaceae bacterium]
MKKHSLLTIAFLAFTFGGLLFLQAEESEWSQWRGPQRDGHAIGPIWPEKLDDESLKVEWKVELGPSYSGPIVRGDRVFVTETVDKKSERVTAFDRNTGEELWSQEWKGAMSVPFFARSNGSWIRATPAADDTTLYVAGIRDVLVAIDIETGTEKWRIDFVDKLESPLPSFGYVSSPLIDGAHLYVQAGASVIKIDKENGEIIWRSMNDGGGMNGSAFSSPVIETVGGERQLLVQSRTALAGLSLETGEVLWSQDVPAFRGMNIVTPTKIGEQLFTSSYGGKSFMYGIDKTPDGYSVSEKWANKVQGYMSSPVVIDDHIYLHLRNRRFACLDAESGEEKWITKPFGQYWSLLAQGNRILALDERGELLLIAANPVEFEILDRKKVSDESTWAHVAFDHGQLFVRDLKGLTVYRWAND